MTSQKKKSKYFKHESTQKSVPMKLLSTDFWLYANPIMLLMNMKGGKRAEAGQWTLEIQKMLNGIEKSITALENLMNQTEMKQKMYVGDSEIKITDEDKYWMYIYIVDNANLRIYACLDKIAQMYRCYFEHDNNGGALKITRKCKCSEKMDERNCNFGALVTSLNSNKTKRNTKIIAELNRLNSNKSICELRKYRNTFTHSKHNLDRTTGLDPKVSSENQSDGTMKTTFSFGVQITSINWFRIEIINANNAIVDCLTETQDTMFPKDFKISLKKK